MSSQPERAAGQRPADDEGGLRPYLMVVLVAAVIVLALAIYVAGYREEIVAILTQSPT